MLKCKGADFSSQKQTCCLLSKKCLALHCVSLSYKFKMCLIHFLVFSIFDGDNNGYITVTEWVEGLAVLLRGTLEEKMKRKIDLYANI